MLMKPIITLFGVLTFFNVNSQIATTSIQFNNVGGQISDAGIFFNKIANQTAGYEVPSGSGNNVIYSSAFWFGGVDINGQLKLAAQDIYNQGSDLWPGALTANGAANTVTPNPLGQTLWNITKAEINNHIANYAQPGYTAPASIMNWPAHGDVLMNQSYYLAPFVDVNFNGDYEPELGDYPCIKGDYAVYTILNDKGNVHYSGGYPIGLEIHFMFYQFATDDALDNTTFIDVEIHNRGTQSLANFATSFLMDGDLGGALDDFVGCDSTRNMMYQYNADDFDADMSGILGYGANPPSFGVKLLNDTLTSSIAFINTNLPYSNPIEMYNSMMGLNLNGSPILDANMNETKFQFYDNPNNTNGWSEETAGDVPGDRKSMMSIVVPWFTPYSKLSYSYAIVYSRDGADNFDNVNELFDVADQIQTYFDANIEGQCEFVLGTSDLEAIEIQLYPNPSNGAFSVHSNGIGITSIIVSDMAGRRVYKETNNNKLGAEVLLHCEPGMYMVTIETIKGLTTKSLMIE